MGNNTQSVSVQPGYAEVQASPPDAVESPERILELLADDGVRRILEATASDSLTVADIATQCAIPSATAYRKVNALNEQGF